MKDSLFGIYLPVILLAILIILIAVFLVEPACGDTLNIGDAQCGANLNVAGRYYRLTENMSCPDVGLNPTAANITIDLNGYTLTYGDDGVGTGAVNGCNTRAEMENVDCYWNAGATGIHTTGDGFLNLTIKNGSIRSFITDTSVSDTTLWSASTIVGSTAFNGLVVENCSLFVYTANSRAIVSQYFDNC